MKLDPKQFGLPSRTLLEQIENKTIAIVINRKSRVIMSDGHKILEKAHKIKKLQEGATIVLKTTAPLCSKTKNYLEQAGIDIWLIQKSK